VKDWRERREKKKEEEKKKLNRCRIATVIILRSFFVRPSFFVWLVFVFKDLT